MQPLNGSRALSLIAYHGTHMFTRSTIGIAIIVMAVSSTAALAQAPAPKITRIRGDIVSLNDNTLVVHRNSGDTVSITLPPMCRLAP